MEQSLDAHPVSTPAPPPPHPAKPRRRFALPEALRIERDPLRMMLFFLMIISISRIHQHYKFIGKLRPALILVMLTAAYAYMNPKYLSPDGLFRTWPSRVMLALGIWACIAAPFGVSLGGSGLFIIEEYSKVLVFAFLLVVGIRRAGDLYTLVWAYVISTGILVYFSLFVFGISKSKGSEAYRLSHLYTFDANDIGLVVLIGMALTLLTLQTSKKWGRIWSGVILVGIGATLARTGSRGAFVGLIVTGLALFVMVRSVSFIKKFAFLAVAVAALVLWAPPGYWEQMETLLNPKEDYNWTEKDGRKQVTQRGIGYMLHYPIFGVGINNFWRMECIEGAKAKTGSLIPRRLRCTPPHNSYLQAGAELGFPGLIMWCSLVFGGIIAMRRLWRRLPKAWLHGDREERFLYLATQYIMLALISFSITSFFLSFAWLDPLYILAAFMAGLYVSVWRKLGWTAPDTVRGGRPMRGVRPPAPRPHGPGPAPLPVPLPLPVPSPVPVSPPPSGAPGPVLVPPNP